MKPLISYYGGKQRIAKWIISHFPEHRTYVEPFCGGAAVFFAKEPAEVNVLNDTNEMLINLYLEAQQNPEELFRLIDATPHSRAEYQRAADIYKAKIDAGSVEKAWATYTAVMQAFGNKAGEGWAFQLKSYFRINEFHTCKTTSKIKKHKENLTAAQKLLEHALVSNMDGIECIEAYDSDDTLFYIDPPYIGTDQGHYKGYTGESFMKLLELLKTIKGKFVLSQYYSEEITNTCYANEWRLITKKTICTVSKKDRETGKKKQRVEALILNF